MRIITKKKVLAIRLNVYSKGLFFSGVCPAADMPSLFHNRRFLARII